MRVDSQCRWYNSSDQANPRSGLPNISPDQQGDIFETVNFLLTDPIFDGI